MPVPTPTIEIGFGGAVAGILTFDRSLFDGTDVFGSRFTEFFDGPYDDVTADAESYVVRRGRDEKLTAMRAGELELRVSRPTDPEFWNPQNPGSPLAALDPGFGPMRPVRVRQAADGAGGQLTLSGNEITDAVRAAGVQGDGRVPEGSMGVWEASTNTQLHSSFEQNSIASSFGAATLARSQDWAFFGGWSLKVETPMGAFAGGRGIGRFSSLVAATPGQVWTAQLRALCETPGINLQIGIEWFNAASAYIGGSYSTVPATGTTQKITWTATAPANTAFVSMMLRVVNPELSAAVYYCDAVQLEQQPLATPYVHTDGATATRAAARVRAPAALLDETQGWVAMRVRMGWGNTNEPLGGSGFPAFFNWQDSGTERLLIFYNEASNGITFDRDSGAGGLSRFIARAVSQGDLVTIIAAWTATEIRLSLDGAAFQVASNSAVPTLAATTFDIGATASGSQHFDSDVLWFACGTGTLTDHDAARLHARLAAGEEPYPSELPAAMEPTLVWLAETGEYLTPAVERGRFFGFLRSASYDPDSTVATIHAQDARLWFSRVKPTIASTGATTTGAVIGLLLDAAEWPNDLRDLAAGDALADFSADGTVDVNVLVDALLETERGSFFVDGDGVAVYRDRHHRSRLTAAEFTLDEQLVELQPGFDLDRIKNRITVTKTGGTPQTAEHTQSQQRYGIADAAPITSPYLASDTIAADLAGWLMQQLAEPETPTPVYVEGEDARSLEQLLDTGLDTWLAVEETLAGTSGDYHVEQLEERFDGVLLSSRFLLSRRPVTQSAIFDASAFDDGSVFTY